jgi:hypothetical protein
LFFSFLLGQAQSRQLVRHYHGLHHTWNNKHVYYR